MSKNEFIKLIESLIKTKNFTKLLEKAEEYIEKYPYELEGYYYKAIAISHNFNYKIGETSEALEVINKLKCIIIDLDPKDKYTKKIDNYIIDLTRNLNLKISEKEPKKLTENQIAGIITLIIIVILVILIF